MNREEDEITTLDGVTTARYVVTIVSGARHLFDLDGGRVTRYGSPDAQWAAGGMGFGAVTPDGHPLAFDELHGATVGQSMLILDASEWRMTSTVQAIVPARTRPPTPTPTPKRSPG